MPLTNVSITRIAYSNYLKYSLRYPWSLKRLPHFGVSPLSLAMSSCNLVSLKWCPCSSKKLPHFGMLRLSLAMAFVYPKCTSLLSSLSSLHWYSLASSYFRIWYCVNGSSKRPFKKCSYVLKAIISWIPLSG